MENAIVALLQPSVGVGTVSILLICAGLLVLKNLKKDSPLNPYILQILGITFILPVILLVSLTTDVKSDAIMGLLGTVVGYVFGTSKISDQKNSENLTKRNSES